MTPATRAPASEAGPWDWAELRRRARAEALRLVSGEDAEDAAQEALIRAWRGQSACRSPDAPGPWLRTIARNEAFRQLERTGRFEQSAGDDRLPDVLSHWPEDGLVTRLSVDQALAQLNEEDRQLVTLRYSLDLSDVVIGEILGIAEATVRVRLHRVRKRLRPLLDR